MMQSKFLLILLALIFSFSIAKAEYQKDKSIDLDKFSGIWLEMVRTPNYLQKKCNYSSVNYQFSYDNELEITNLCITFNNTKKKKVFHSSLINKNETNRTFYIEYTGIMGFIKPFSKGNFHIFYVNDDYTIAIVGHPDKSEFWILSRELLYDQEIKNTIIIAKSYGLDTKKLIFDDFSPEIKSDIIELFD